MTKGFFRFVAGKLPLRLLPTDSTFRVFQRLSSWLAGVTFFCDWQLEARGRPQFFKHQIDIARWPFEPHRWSFTARGVYAREVMFKGCTVLDLCCGDGSYSYLFFSDIARQVIAIDNDEHAIRYARKYHATRNVSFRRMDILRDGLPGEEYDVVVWNAAICYFSETEIGLVLSRVIAASKPTLKLVGMLPKANGWIDHKTEFDDASAVNRFLRQYFGEVVTREIDEGAATSFYFQAAVPLKSSQRGG